MRDSLNFGEADFNSNILKYFQISHKCSEEPFEKRGPIRVRSSQ
jgi:hypothetical protein